MSELQSMTGFASATNASDNRQIICEMRSVNGKNLDIRVRVPAGFEAYETEIKKSIAAKIARGNLQVSISIDDSKNSSALIIDQEAFSAIAGQAIALAKKHDVAAPTCDGILAVRGVVIADDAINSQVEIDEQTKEAVFTTVKHATDNLVSMRETEGASLKSILATHLHSIAQHTIAARDDKASSTEAIRERLLNQLATMLKGASDGTIDPERLHAEVAILATKADIREEIDRLRAHVAAASDLLAEGGAVGRKLDFLAQEFNRETNTICSKSTSASLTATGLALKAVIDQFREQVQNLQ
jgi:uncharacterized protein (TIGR00255 family)